MFVFNFNLRKFLDSFQKIENSYLDYEKTFSKDILSEEWRKLTSLIFSSITALSDFILDFREIYFKDNPEDFDFFAFYWDLLVSKIKHSFATEIPRKPFYLPTILLYDKVPSLGEKLISYRVDKARIPVIFLKLYLRLFLTYDFVFYKNEGVFTRFRLDKDYFRFVKEEIFGKDSKSLDDLSSLREFLENLIIHYIQKSLYFWTKEEQYLQVEGKEVYREVLDTYRKGQKVFLEPFSYFLAFKMWKYGKLLQTSYEFCNSEKRRKFCDRFIDTFEEYKHNQLEFIDRFYGEKITNETLLKEIFDLDKKFLKAHIFKQVLVPYDIPSATQFKSLCAEIKRFSIFKALKKKTDKVCQDELKNIFSNYLISNEEYDKFRWERLLVSGNSSQISLVLSAMKKVLPSACFQYVGVLRAGGLLAHCLNVMTNSDELWKYPVVLFSSFPYISLVPRDINLLKADQLKEIPLMVVDESIKSSFTFYMLMNYLYRNFRKFEVDRKVKGLVCLADIEGFERVTNPQFEQEIFSVAKVSIKDTQLSLANISKEAFSVQPFDWKGFIENVPEASVGIFEKIKPYITLIIDNNERLNVTYVTSNSLLLFAAAKDLAKKLRKSACALGFYYATDQGKILTDAIVFVSKFLWNEVKIGVVKDREDWERFSNEHPDSVLVFTDITVSTMHTFLRALKIDFGISTSISNLEEDLKGFPVKVATVFTSEEVEKRLGNQLVYVGKLDI